MANGIVGTIFSWFGFGLKGRMCSLEKSHDELKHSVRFEDTCDATHTGLNSRLDSFEKLQKETRDDVKTLLGR